MDLQENVIAENTLNANKESFNCIYCGKVLMEKNTQNISTKDDLVIKSRLVFLNSNGEVLCRCIQCKKLVTLPLNFLSEALGISKK